MLGKAPGHWGAIVQVLWLDTELPPLLRLDDGGDAVTCDLTSFSHVG